MKGWVLRVSEGYVPTVAALEAAWVASRVARGTEPGRAAEEFARALAAIRGVSDA